jgi:hypothetical protein
LVFSVQNADPHDANARPGPMTTNSAAKAATSDFIYGSPEGFSNCHYGND